MDAVRANRRLIGAAIEEALRFDGPVLMQSRQAMTDSQLGGVTIPPAALIEVVAGAANRDPDVRPDPDRFVISRKRDAHWSFSRGPHICVGQHLARVEMTRAVVAILDRLAGLRHYPDTPAPKARGIMMRMPQPIFVRFDQ